MVIMLPLVMLRAPTRIVPVLRATAAYVCCAPMEEGGESWMVDWEAEAERASWLGPWTARPGLEAACFTVQPAGRKGLGLFAAVPIERGAYLFDYEGSLVLGEEFTGSDYALEVRNAAGRYFLIDAADKAVSSIARYMNHDAKDPNCELWRQAFEQVDANQEDATPPRVHVLANRAIERGEELCINYGEVFWRSASEMKRGEREIARKEKHLRQLEELAAEQAKRGAG